MGKSRCLIIKLNLDLKYECIEKDLLLNKTISILLSDNFKFTTFLLN